jgi:hypothetical protein
MKSEEWKTYRTRFLVTAKQLISTLTFVDHLGRQHCGRKGDYLVESSDGVLSIAPRRIFEDIYVPISQLDETPLRQTTVGQTTPSEPKLDELKFEPLDIEQIKLPKSRTVSQRVDAASAVRHEESDRVRRKLPQPCRVRPSGSRLGLM